MKYNAEKIQNKAVHLTSKDINKMVGQSDDEEDFADNEDEGEEIEDFDIDPDLLESFEDDEEEPQKGDISLLNHDISLIEPEREGDRISINSNEMISGSSEQEDSDFNEHGFLDPSRLNTYKKRYQEKKDQLKNEEKEKYSHTRKEKIGGKTNKQHNKNKPMMMIIPKKRREIKLEGKVESMNKKIKG